MGLLRIIWTTFMLCILIYISTIALAFFGVPFRTYGPFLIWILTLALMASFLPETNSSVFN